MDFFIGETFWHFGEGLLCLERIKAKTKLPAMITLLEQEPATELNRQIIAHLRLEIQLLQAELAVAILFISSQGEGGQDH